MATEPTRTRDYDLKVIDEDRVLDDLADRAFQAPARFLLREEVARLSLIQGFDQLLSLIHI